MPFTRDKAINGSTNFKRDKAAPTEEPGFLSKAWGALKPGLSELTDFSNAADVLRTGIDAVSLGGADYLAGGDQAELTRQAKERLGGGALPVELGASFLTPTGVPQKIGRGAQILGHGLSGGAQNIVNEWTHGERDIGDLAWAGGTGAVASAGGSALMDPIASLFSRRKAAKDLPSTESLKTEGKAGYEDVKSKGGVYHRDDIRTLLAEFKNMKLTPGVDDRAIALRKGLEKSWKGQDITPDKLDQMRRIIRGKMKTANASDRILGEDFVKGMDKFAEKTPVTGPSGADIPGINETLKAARSRYAQYYKAKEVDDASPIKEGLFNAFGEVSDAPAVKRFKGIKKKIDKKGGAGYTPAEQAGVAKVAKPGAIRSIGQIARTVSPLGGKIPFALNAITGLVSSGTSLPFTAAAQALSTLGKSATQSDINDLQSIIKTGKGISADPAAVAAMKDKFARMMSAATRTGYNPIMGAR